MALVYMLLFRIAPGVIPYKSHAHPLSSSISTAQEDRPEALTGNISSNCLGNRILTLEAAWDIMSDQNNPQAEAQPPSEYTYGSFHGWTRQPYTYNDQSQGKLDYFRCQHGVLLHCGLPELIWCIRSILYGRTARG